MTTSWQLVRKQHCICSFYSNWSTRHYHLQQQLWTSLHLSYWHCHYYWSMLILSTTTLQGLLNQPTLVVTWGSALLVGYHLVCTRWVLTWEHLLLVTCLLHVCNIYCDTITDGGGWIVIQRNRKNSQLSFNKNWREYEDGFGDLNNDFWAGLKLIDTLTQTGQWEMRVDYQKNEGLLEEILIGLHRAIHIMG